MKRIILITAVGLFLLTGCCSQNGRVINQGSFTLLRMDKRNKDQLYAYSEVVKQEKRIAYNYNETNALITSTPPVIKETATGFGAIISGLWSSLIDMLGFFKDGCLEIGVLKWGHESKYCYTNRIENIKE